MTWQLIDEDASFRTYVLVADPGDDAMEVLGNLARAENLSARS
jgi:predicted DNA-binding protein with PD1-like motif